MVRLEVASVMITSFDPNVHRDVAVKHMKYDHRPLVEKLKKNSNFEIFDFGLIRHEFWDDAAHLFHQCISPIKQ